MCGCGIDVPFWNQDIFGSDPMWCRHPLRCECLDVFDGVVGGEDEELADEVQTDVVGDVGCGLPMERFAVEVLRGWALDEAMLWNGGVGALSTWEIQVSMMVGVTAAPTVRVLKGIVVIWLFVCCCYPPLVGVAWMLCVVC